MSFGLLLPGALLALAALLLPVLLHLVRQTDRKRVEFAAMRWLNTRAQPRRRPRIDEWLLLAVRLLLLALVAMWLAQPVWFGPADTRPWLLVHPAISPSRAPSSMEAGEQRRWLAPGFPALDQPAPAGTTSVGSLLRELDASLPSSAAVEVLVPARFDATDAERPVLRRRVAWTVVPGTTAFAAMEPARATSIAMHVDPAHRAALPYVRAASAAWVSGTPTPKPAPLRELKNGDALRANDTHVIWLSVAPMPASTAAWVRNGGVVLLSLDGNAGVVDWSKASEAWRRDDGLPLARRVQDGKGAWVQMLVPFDPQSLPLLLEPGFPGMLQELLAASPDIATRATAEGYAPVAGAAASYPQDPWPIGHWFAWLIALLFGIERWLAASPRRIRS